MVKLEWDDPKKELARRELRNSIITFFDKKVRRNLEIVHLPGATDLEYQNVYKSLGINPEGIIGVERDPEIFTMLERKKSKGEIQYKLFYGTLEEFISITKKRFDVVSADTTELFGIPQLEMVHNIFQGEVIKDRGILYTEFAAKRDNSKYHLQQAIVITHPAHIERLRAYFEAAQGYDVHVQKLDDKIAREFEQEEAELQLNYAKKFNVEEMAFPPLVPIVTLAWTRMSE